MMPAATAPALRILIWPFYQVQANGCRAPITECHAVILGAVRAARGRPVSLRDLSEAIWPDPDAMPEWWEGVIHNHVTRLRKRLALVGIDGRKIIRAHHGLGYRWGGA